MSLQGPLIVVAEQPAPELVEALGAAGAFPIVEAKWADAPTAFVAVKPAGVVIAEPGPPPSETQARMLLLQILTVKGPMVPTVAMAPADGDAAVPNALTVTTGFPVGRVVERLRYAMRVRSLHATVLRRIELFAAQRGAVPTLPSGDALDDATVLVAGRGPLYPSLSTAMGERVKMIGALSVETAAKYLNARDIDGIVVGDGFSPRMVEAFLTVLAQDTRFRDIPIAVIGEAAPEFAETLPNIDFIDGEPSRLIARMVPMLRLHAFETRLKRSLTSLETDGMIDSNTGLLTRDAFGRDLAKSITDAADRSQALSLARYTFDGPLDPRAAVDAARLVTRLIRNFDFACREDDGAVLVAFAQTNLRSAHVIARRLAAAFKNAILAPHRAHDKVTVQVTLATLKNGDTVDSLMHRVMGNRMVAAE